jgi:hypothetical protein
VNLHQGAVFNRIDCVVIRFLCHFEAKAGFGMTTLTIKVMIKYEMKATSIEEQTEKGNGKAKGK